MGNYYIIGRRKAWKEQTTVHDPGENEFPKERHVCMYVY